MDLATDRGLTAALRSRGYHLRGPAGVGARGTAWAATAPDGRRVVVGVVDLDLPIVTRREALGRLERLRGVEHPHLARLVDVVAVDQHRTALVTEAVEGPTVGAVASVRGGWPAGEVVTLLVPLAEALAALHTVGLAHGDVAPENAVLAPGGRPVLVDLAGAVIPGGALRGEGAARGAVAAQGDVAALARLGLDLLDADGGALREVLQQAVRDRPAAADLAARVYGAAPAVPVTVPEAAVLTRVALTRLAAPRQAPRTEPDPRTRRRRQVVTTLGGLAASAALLGALVALLPARQATAPQEDIAEVATELTLRRAQVLADRDPARLAEVVLEGSPAEAADAALLAALEGVAEQPVRATVEQVRPLGEEDGRALVAVTSTFRYGTAPASPREVVLALVETEHGWRVAEVLEPDDAAALTQALRP